MTAATLGGRFGQLLTRARLILAVQVFTSLTLLNELYQFVTAGRLFPQGGPEKAHAAGAVPLHVLSGLAAVAVVLRHLAVRGRRWPVVLALVVFIATFVQAATGGRDHLAVHVPGAMILTVGSAWLTAWAFLRAPKEIDQQARRTGRAS